MKKLYIILSIVICSFANIFNANADPLVLFIDSHVAFDENLNNGSDWPLAFQSVNQALEYIDVTGRDVIFLLKYGYQEPIKIGGRTNIASVEIYGGCDEWCRTPEDRLLDDPTTRTIIEGTDLPAIWFESLPRTSRNIVDGLTLVGGTKTESLAIRMVGCCETIFSRCRIQDTDNTGNLIFIEGSNHEGNPNYLISFVNTVISDNNVTNIVKTFFSCRFVNSTIVNNDCTNFMSINYPDTYDIFEIKNSIVKNTSCVTTGGSVMVYCSSVASFRYFVDMEEHNTSGLNIEFTNEAADPYKHVPNQYITAKGNLDYYTSYANIIPDGNLDIIGSRRYVRNTIDIGAYQCSQSYSRSYAPEFIDEEYEEDFEDEYEEYEEEDMLLTNINIYPTKLNSGQTLHFEHNLENSLFVRIYNLSGIEMVSQEIANNDDIYLSLPTGMYIVTMSNPETEEIVRQEKIVVTN